MLFNFLQPLNGKIFKILLQVFLNQ